MSKLTEFARNQPCTILIDGVCNHDWSTTVAAHFPAIELGGGRGHKVHDALAAHACACCHDVIDRRAHLRRYELDYLRNLHARGVLVTVRRILDAGFTITPEG